MGNFLKAINEATPTGNASPGGKIKTGNGLTNNKPEGKVKKGGFLNKVASVAQKSANFIQKGAEVARGKWDINNVLQGILDKQLDSSTSKVGSFGKSNFNKIKLGDDIVKKINAYGQDVEETTAAVEANESFNKVFLSTINEAMAAMHTNADEKGKFKSIGKASKNAQVWEVLKSTLDIQTEFKLKDPETGKSQVDRRVVWISKGVPAFLKAIKELYPDIPFTYEGHDEKEGLSSVDIAKEQEEEFNFEDTTKQEWIASLSEEQAEEIVKGLVDIYPGDRIKFDEPGDTDSDEPESTEDEKPTGPVEQLTVENAIFELAGRTSFGEKGIQFTLKPISTDIISILKDRDIKYLTYLLQSRDNEFKTAEGNSGIIYAYDEGNQPINEITTEGVNFQWTGQEKLYTLSSDNKELMGVKYSEGQYPINKSAVKPLTDGKHILMRPDEKSGYMKFGILQDLPTTKQFLINFKKGVEATPEEIKEADAVADPSPVQKAG
tara:strand:- start:490 stop:1968 length:1479 start_codon:yes stop_codon:yes gene_type:complete